MRDKVADPDFLRMREIEHGLQERMPGRYLTRYQLVTFTRIPYRVALLAGRSSRASSRAGPAGESRYERRRPAGGTAAGADTPLHGIV